MSELPSRERLPTDPPAPAAATTPAFAQPATARLLLRLARPRQWTKNLLLFAALVFAEKLFEPRAFGLAVLAFVSFSMASSSVYVVNDLLDAERDRMHPRKRRRPIASGEIPPMAAGFVAGLATALALSLAWWIRPGFALAVLVYLTMSHFYSLVGKNLVIFDVMLIAAGFVIRAVAGAVAIDVPSSDWFILCTLFVALFLALSKRRAEMMALDVGAGRARPVLEKYTASMLGAFTATSMGAALISYALYVFNIRGQSGRDFHPLELTVPFVLFGVFRYHLLVETRGLGERPEDVLFQDRPFQLCLLGFAVVAVAALYLGS